LTSSTALAWRIDQRAIEPSGASVSGSPKGSQRRTLRGLPARCGALRLRARDERLLPSTPTTTARGAIGSVVADPQKKPRRARRLRIEHCRASHQHAIDALTCVKSVGA
jgi:hypothetical protein